MIAFLKELAREMLLQRGRQLARYCFVVPNKRSATFLARYFQECMRELTDAHKITDREVLLLPEITTISEFVTGLCGLEIDSRIDLLFTLFNLYRSMEGAEADFDKFKVWGEIALSDFNDVDMYCADAQKLFKNVEDLNEIATDYLTDDQRRVVEEYFRPLGGVAQKNDSFWKHVNRNSKNQQRFLHLWQTMGKLYTLLDDKLAERGLCRQGRAYKLALKAIRERGAEALPYRQVVFVGFNALTTVEFNIFKEIQQIAVADPESGDDDTLGDYYWDAAGQVLTADDSATSAARFISKNIRNFPSKLTLSECMDTTGFPSTLKVVACPGNTTQVKVASEILSDIIKRDPEAAQGASVAVAMPDENLFFPMLYSLPSELKRVNISMGYPLRITSAASWITLLRRLQVRSKGSEPQFFHEDVTALLSHPISRLILSEELCNTLLSVIKRNRLFLFGYRQLIAVMQSDYEGRKLNLQPDAKCLNYLQRLLYPLQRSSDAIGVCVYLQVAIETAINALIASIGSDTDSDGEVIIKGKIELWHLRVYSDALARFRETVMAHKVNMNLSTALSLIDRVLANENVALRGEPLLGVQVLGMLETRSLDFDYIIIPSMNENIFPRRLRNRSFIPDSLRRGFGIATTRFQESIFAYYFYRLISRAKEVYMLYDARQGGLHSGDPSRYIYQLKYLYPESANLIEEARRVSVAMTMPRTLTGKKTEEVNRILEQYLTPGSGKALSASALKKYLSCELQFFFHYIKGIKVEENFEETMDAATQGTIFHETMHHLYASRLQQAQPGKGALITQNIIEGWLNHPTLIEEIMRQKINKFYLQNRNQNLDKPLEGFAAIYMEPIKHYVEQTLLADLKKTPFIYLDGEHTLNTEFDLQDGRKVNMLFIIDRLDYTDSHTRIVDYKTGSDATSFSKMQQLFDLGGANPAGAIFQLMTYALCYENEYGPQSDLDIAICRPAVLETNDYSYELQYKDTKLDYAALKEEFRSGLIERMKRLFSPDEDFKQFKPGISSASGPCDYCDYKSLCGKK